MDFDTDELGQDGAFSGSGEVFVKAHAEQQHVLRCARVPAVSALAQRALPSLFIFCCLFAKAIL